MGRRGVQELAVLVAALLMVTACTGPEEPEPTTTEGSAATATDQSPATSGAGATDGAGATSPTPTASPEPSPQGSTAAPATTEPASPEPTAGGELPTFPANAAPDTAEPSEGTMLHLSDIRSASHDGYDRVVLQFEGNGEPGWHAAYTNDPAAAGSGRPIEGAGDAALSISISMGSVPSNGEMQVSPGQWDPELTEIDEIYLGGWFEGYLQVVLGVDSQQPPFRVFSLDDPTRVVIDVAHADD